MTAPLDRIRGALRSLRAEAKALSLKEACVAQMLQSRRVASAAREAKLEKDRGRAAAMAAHDHDAHDEDVDIT